MKIKCRLHYKSDRFLIKSKLQTLIRLSRWYCFKMGKPLTLRDTLFFLIIQAYRRSVKTLQLIQWLSTPNRSVLFFLNWWKQKWNYSFTSASGALGKQASVCSDDRIFYYHLTSFPVWFSYCLRGNVFLLTL